MSILVGNPFFLDAGAAGGGYEIERSLRFNSSDSAFLSRVPSTAGNRDTYTFSAWIKRSSLGAQPIFECSPNSNENTGIYFTSSNELRFQLRIFGSYNLLWTTTAVYRDPSAWYHVVISVDTGQASTANTVKIYINGVAQTVSYSAASGSYSQNMDTGVNSTGSHHIGYQLDGASYLSGYLADIHFIDGIAATPSDFAETDATTAQWIPKLYSGSYGTNGFQLKFADNSSNTATTLGKDTSGNSNNWTPNNFAVDRTQPNYISAISFENCSLGGGSIANGFDTSTSTFFNTTNATNSTIVFAPTIPITINSSLVFYGALGSNQGWSVKIGSTTLASGQNEPGSPYTIPNAAGKTISSSDPLRLISDGAGEGVYLSALVVDGLLLVNAAGAGNDSLVDTPTSYGTDTGAGGEVRGNYCTWNPLFANSAFTISNGNLDLATSSVSDRVCASTFGLSSGKWYWEVTINGGAGVGIGVCTSAVNLASYLGGTSASRSYDWSANKYPGGASYGTSYTTGDVIGVAVDVDAGTLVYYKNGASQGTAFTDLAGSAWFPALGDQSNSGNVAISANFGQRPFAYTAPSGFKALVDTNLTAPVIAKPNTVMDVKLYTGNASTNAITGLGFSPDLVWIKSRSSANWHNVLDTVRGNLRILYTNDTRAEAVETVASLTSFDSTGFTLSGNGDTGVNNVNGNGISYTAWTWDAGSSTVTNTQGSITSQCRTSVSSGFSIVTYSGNGTAGATVGHNLGVAPSLLIVKDRTTTRDWLVYSKEIGNTKYLALNSTIAAATFNIWNNTTPTSSVFSLSSAVDVNSSSSNYVCYAFAPVAGYGNGFSYTGNGSTDGSFVYLGFRPRLILVKRTDTTGNWTLLDTAREGYNVDNDPLYPNLSDAEGTADLLDITSNGFKLRSTDASVNANTGTYVGFAWAENPFQYARAR